MENLGPGGNRSRKSSTTSPNSEPAIARTISLNVQSTLPNEATQTLTAFNKTMLNGSLIKGAGTNALEHIQSHSANQATNNNPTAKTHKKIGDSASNTISSVNSTINLQGANRKKFRTIAKGLGMMSRAKVAAADTAAISREQAAFLNKYGMTMTGEVGASHSRDSLWNYVKWEYLKEKLVIDPSRDLHYYWTGVVSMAYSYNLWFCVFRCVFIDADVGFFWIIFFIILDILADCVYVIDCFCHSRTGYLEQGLLVRDVQKITKRYWKSPQRNMDLLSFLPVDYICEAVFMTPKPILRFNRLVRLNRMQMFINATETRISIPNAFRIGCVVIYILFLIHWNACVYFLASSIIGLGNDSWVYGKLNIQSLPPSTEDSLARRYIYSFYWSTLMMTTIGEVPGPVTSAEFVFVTFDVMCGVLIFAIIVGNVGSMIANMSNARSEFQNSVDSMKQYLGMRKISKHLVTRVLKWFDYLWANKQSLNDNAVLEVLPTKLQAEIAMHVHFETLRKVRIFQDCEAGLLAELVLKLQLQVFSPMDYVCKKGDVGREMYIVKRGRLQVVGDDGIKVFHNLTEGSVFGELSILNIAGSKIGNRRSASIRSVGYTDLFVLNKYDLWEALQEYPDAQKVLIQKGREILRKDNLLEENAPEETKTTDETAIELTKSLEKLQFRLAKLIAEHVNTERKMKSRIEYLERRVKKYNPDEMGP